MCKGWEGFCDRLQCLSHCITWALHYNRILYVDWRDRIWSHGNGDFYRYFSLVDLPYVTSVDQVPPRLQVFPSFWEGKLARLADEWLHEYKSDLGFNPDQGKYYEPVWVFPGVGFRVYDFDQLPKHLRLTIAAREAIQPLLTAAQQPWPVVHLRGTDRAVPENRWADLRNLAPVAYVVSDDINLARRWLRESPDSVLLSDTLVEGSVAGHKLDEARLLQKGFDKHRMNIRLLADFVILGRAKQAYALNEQSVFFSMARLFGACGGFERLFQAAPEASVLSSCYPGYNFEYRALQPIV